MFSFLVEKTASVVSGTYDVVADVGNYIYDDLTNVGQAAKDGWNDPILGNDEPSDVLKSAGEKTASKFGKSDEDTSV